MAGRLSRIAPIRFGLDKGPGKDNRLLWRLSTHIPKPIAFQGEPEKAGIRSRDTKKSA